MVNRTTRAKRKRTPASRPLPGWVWLLTGLVIGLSVTFLPKLNESKQAPTPASLDKPDTSIESGEKRKFDFYTLLPELEVVVDENSASQASNNINNDTGTYVLQVGSFKSAHEADTLKARLALMGVETNIEIVTVNSTKWHRVRVGPSEDKNRLLATQSRLRSEKMDSVLLKVRS